jgi:hypothetical protein
MLRSLKELENVRVILADGQPCGRVKDIYFDDHSWKIRFIKVSLDPARFGHKQVLLVPNQIFSSSAEYCELNLSAAELAECPLDSSFLPVCRQYAVLNAGSPGSVTVRRKLTESDPHLRSAKALSTYTVHFSGELIGILNEFFWNEAWIIRYAGIHGLELAERKRLSFHILTQSIQTISWSTQRVLLHELNPVAIEPSTSIIPAGLVAA